MNERTNERRSLELAAAAIGKNLKGYDWYVTPSNDTEYGYFCAAGDGTHIWNPRRKMDDALALAVELGFTVEICRVGRYTAVHWAGDEIARVVHGTSYEDNARVATRVALTDAAAYVGSLVASYAGEEA